MNTVVRVAAYQPPSTISEVVLALRSNGLEARHEAKHWGDWVHLEGCATVISIESMRGLTSTATIEEGPDDDAGVIKAVFTSFASLGWVGVDEDGEFPLN